MDSYVWYIEDIILLFYVYYCLIFGPSKDKIDDFYACLNMDFKIEDGGELNKYLGM